MSIEIRKFRRAYDLELIAASTSNIIIGTLIWDPILGKPKFDANGMSENIMNIFYTSNITDKAEWEKNLDQLRNEQMVVASFAEKEVDVDIDYVTNLEYPQIGKISGTFDLKSIKKFSFGELKARVMSNLMRVQIDRHLDSLKKNNWDDYDGKLRRVFMITELYYGSVKIVIDKNLSGNLEGSLKNTDLQIANKLVLNESIEYTISHNDVPFAMRIEKVRTFEG